MIRLIVVGIAALLTFASVEVPSVAATESEGHAAAPAPPHVNWVDFGYKSKNAEGDKLEGDEEPMAPPLLAVFINFFIFVGLLVWKAGPPLRSYLTRRHDEVATALAEAARIKEEASRRLDEYERQLGEVDREVDELVEGIRSDAEAERGRIVAEAEATARSLKENADERIEAAVGRARRAIEAEVAAAAISAAERILLDKMTEDDHNQLVETFIAGLASGDPSAGPSGSGGDPEPPPSGDRSRRDSTTIDEGWG